MKTKTKRDVLNKICAILVLTAMIISNLGIVGEAAVSYAIDMMKTSSENVQVLAYFVDENGKEVQNKALDISKSEESLYVKVGVKNEGYFNGKIKLKNPNFVVDKDYIDEGVSEISSDREIVLKQINAGTDEVIELKINPLENMSVKDLQRETKIEITGEYRNSKNIRKEEAEKVQGTTSVVLNWISSEENKMEMTTEVFTNKNFEIEGIEKRLIQLVVKTKITDKNYPVKSTEIVLDKLNGTEEVNVEKIGEKLDYTEENGKIIIKIESDEETKYEEQTIIVTYVLSGNIDTINKEINVNGKVETYDNKTFNTENLVNTGDEKQGTITYEIESEKELYKGKILIGEEKEYKTNIKLNVNYAGLDDTVKIVGQKSTYGIGEEEVEAKNIYKETKINKDQFINIFGEDGYITITDENGVTLANINKNSETDEEGNVVVKYLGESEQVEINTSKPIKTGELLIENTKEIKEIGYSREVKNTLTHINEKVEGNLGIENTQVELKNTTTEAELEVSTDTLSTLETNENVKMTIKLLNNDETKDLYQNPKLRVKLPSEVTDVKAKCKLLYGNGLTLGATNLVKENENYELQIDLNGTQNTYNAEAVEGTTIIIYADMKLDELAASGKENIELLYENEIATSYAKSGVDQVPVDIESKVEVITTNNIEDLNVTSIGGEASKDVKLTVSGEAKNTNVQFGIINNEETKIRDVKVIGYLPTRKGDNLGITLTGGIITEPTNGIRVYYSNKEQVNNNLQDTTNSWSQEFNPETTKSYLIVIDEIESKARVTGSYGINIPENLDYNMSAKEGYTATYIKEGSNETSEKIATELNLTTGAGPDLDIKIKAKVGKDIVGEEKDNKEEKGTQLTAGEIIKYEVTLTNNGTASATDVTVNEIVPENTEPLEYTAEHVADGYGTDGLSHFVPLTEIYKDFASVDSKKIEQIAVGETKTVEFYLRPINTKDCVMSSEFQVNYNDKVESKFISNDVKGSRLSVELLPENTKSEKDELLEGKIYTYKLEIQNNWDEMELDESEEPEEIEPEDEEDFAVKNIKVKIQQGDLFDINHIKTKNGTFYDIDEITLDSVDVSETVLIYLKAKENIVGNNIAQVYAEVSCEDPALNLRSNTITKTIRGVNLDVKVEANNMGEEVNVGQEIDYKITLTNAEDSIDIDDVKIEDTIFNGLNVNEVLMNGEILPEENYSKGSKYDYIESGEGDMAEVTSIRDPLKDLLTINTPIKAGETKTIEIRSTVSNSIRAKLKERTEIINSVSVTTNSGKTIESEEVIHVINPASQEYKIEYSENDYGTEPNTPDNPSNPDNPSDPDNPNNPNDPNNPNNPDNPSNPDNPNNPDEEEKTYTISGMAWFDENENGEKDTQEERLSGITAKLMNLNTNKIETTKTSENGFYSFTGVAKGSYVVIFEYDTEKYMLTTYQADGVGKNKNSDAENVSMIIDGEERKVSSTDTLVVSDGSVVDIDIGLVLARTFDLELSKTISKVTITNGEGTKTTNYDGATYARAEINAKYIEGSTLIVEYKIKVSNTGELAGYAKSIVDYKPRDLSFDSSLNTGWYQSGDNLYSSSLANTKIEPGESKELTLVLTKRITENNMGLVNNLAEIEKDYTALGIVDKDSTPGNKQRGEDDLGSSDISIGVKTGAAISYITFTVSVISVLIAGAYLVSWKLLKSRKEI